MSNRSMETEDELLRETTAFWGGVHSRHAGTCAETRAECAIVRVVLD